MSMEATTTTRIEDLTTGQVVVSRKGLIYEITGTPIIGRVFVEVPYRTLSGNTEYLTGRPGQMVSVA